ncbi:hypothetical protein QLQ12_20245 [Actinoplanes sp. NEAU-A12]|uniref:Rod shape-determining protein MreD n=1 Tax=Actinoplanes sandaracinus TaxID=3045177 RepID=A0ABT6WMJ7_9ACTN|nr:hypothetical protein [Actinoplanes sandaracinus]MDI6100948.1 hypothetical protein [Actinoplanes sandaracinus]
MSVSPRDALRSAAFAAAYLAAFLVTAMIPVFPLPPLVVAGVWLTAQAGRVPRRFDVIALATMAMVAATLQGAGLLMSATVAVWAVIPALLFAVLLEHWLPGYWLGHGDRFRRPRAALGRLAAAAALTAAASLVLHGVIDTDLVSGAVAIQFARDTAVLVLVPLAVRAVRRSRSPRRAGLSVVR